MIGKITTGASFFGCLRYCLEDKPHLSEQQKLDKSLFAGLQHKDRAEVLDYNNCFGNLHDLTRQFSNVASLNKRVEKPVFHFSLRPAPDDVLTKEQLTEIGHQCAKEFGLSENQYVILLHKDTLPPHIHIVANRVDFEGKVAKDSFSCKRMQAFCRKTEEELHLKQVLSARTFLPKELRHLPRQDARKEKLKKDIQQTLEKVNTLQRFEETMKPLSYTVLKGRGICFIDEKKVRIKGSEVGFPLAKIERVLELQQKITQREELQKAKQNCPAIPDFKQQSALLPASKLPKQFGENATKEEVTTVQEEIQVMKKMVNEMIYELFKPQHTDQSVAPELLREANLKKKTLRHRL
jgi:hypothetical protein